jgi:hypothetical protein
MRRHGKAERSRVVGKPRLMKHSRKAVINIFCPFKHLNLLIVGSHGENCELTGNDACRHSGPVIGRSHRVMLASAYETHQRDASRQGNRE